MSRSPSRSPTRGSSSGSVNSCSWVGAGLTRARRRGVLPGASFFWATSRESEGRNERSFRSTRHGRAAAPGASWSPAPADGRAATRMGLPSAADGMARGGSRPRHLPCSRLPAAGMSVPSAANGVGDRRLRELHGRSRRPTTALRNERSFHAGKLAGRTWDASLESPDSRLPPTHGARKPSTVDARKPLPQGLRHGTGEGRTQPPRRLKTRPAGVACGAARRISTRRADAAGGS